MDQNERLNYHRRMHTTETKIFGGWAFRNYLLTDFMRICANKEVVRVLDYGSGRAMYLYDESFGTSLHELLKGKLQTFYCYDPGSLLYEEPPAPSSKFCAGSIDRVTIDQIDSELNRIRNWCDEDGIVLFKMRSKMPGEDDEYVTHLPVWEWARKFNSLGRNYHFIFIDNAHEDF